MATILCPNCDSELLETDENCSKCGWLNINPNIDNSAAISKMLAGEISEETPDTRSSAFDTTTVKVEGELTPEQVEAFQSGEAIEFLPGSDELLDMENLTGFSVPDIINYDDDELLDQGNSGADLTEKSEKVKKSSKKSPFIIRIIINVLLVFVAFSMGVIGFYLYNQNLYVDDTYQIGHDAVITIMQNTTGQKSFKATAIYIKPATNVTQCVVFGNISESAGYYTPTYYRLEIDNANLANTKLYYAFDENEYLRLKNGNEEARIKASIMKNYHDTYLKFIDEINTENSLWRFCNVDYINLKINEENKK